MSIEIIAKSVLLYLKKIESITHGCFNIFFHEDYIKSYSYSLRIIKYSKSFIYHLQEIKS